MKIKFWCMHSYMQVEDIFIWNYLKVFLMKYSQVSNCFLAFVDFFVSTRSGCVSASSLYFLVYAFFHLLVLGELTFSGVFILAPASDPVTTTDFFDLFVGVFWEEILSVSDSPSRFTKQKAGFFFGRPLFWGGMVKKNLPTLTYTLQSTYTLQVARNKTDKFTKGLQMKQILNRRLINWSLPKFSRGNHCHLKPVFKIWLIKHC